MMKDIARKKALEILNIIEKQRQTLDSALDALDTSMIIDRRDMRLFTAIVYGVLRHRSKLDFIIEKFSNKPLKKIDSEILNILRIGLFQITFLTRIPASAAVNTSVELSKNSKNKNISKFVNGILRNILRNIETLKFPDQKIDTVNFIAIDKSFPKWLVKKWMERWDAETVNKLCGKLNEIPDITIRANLLKTNRERLCEELSSHVNTIDKTPVSPSGLQLTSPDCQLNQLDAFKNGWFQVQDEAAQLVGYILAPQPGDKVLDACAGLGGKTAHIAELMKNVGEITAADVIHKKLETLEVEMKRLGITIVKTRSVDMGSDGDFQKEFFDKVLVDAPCSGLGVIRRNPDTKWLLSKKNLHRYAKRQISFLNNAAKFVKKGGILVYAVCSTEPEENENVKEIFLQQNPDFKLDSSLKNKFLEAFSLEKGEIKTSPLKDDMDGFYSVRFIRDN